MSEINAETLKSFLKTIKLKDLQNQCKDLNIRETVGKMRTKARMNARKMMMTETVGGKLGQI